jgi:hypothetical protein
MKTLRLNSILLFLLAVSANTLLGQSIVKIADVKIVAAGETLTIPAGSIIELGAGAVLQVEGSLVMNGTASNPIRIKNIDVVNPGLGIVISSSESQGKIELSNVIFENQIQPIRFDPFWHRKAVEINNIFVTQCTSGEPLIYVATSLTDLREGKKISFNMNGGTFVNNTAGILLENVGSDGINYSINNLTFSDNHLSGSDNSLGLIHFDFATVAKSSNVNVGKLNFIRNYAGSNPVGLSVSGTGTQVLNVDAIYQPNLAEDILFDKHIDNRIPSIVVGKREAIAASGLSNIITGVSHNFGQVRMTTIGSPTIVKIIDSTGNKVDYKYSKQGDTLLFDYIQGYPAKGILDNGQLVNIPKLTLTPVQALELSKVDTAEYNKFLREKSNGVAGQEQSDVIGIGVNLPMFKSKGEVIKKIHVWEIGMWGGGGIYGGGDIKHKFAPLPSTIEISLGGYGQYNFNSRFSLKGSLYYTEISIHNIWATGLFSGTSPLISYDQNYQEFNLSGNSFPVHFWTRMGIAEVEGMWHLRPYQITAGKSSKLIPTVGLSVGMIYFNTYRYAYTNQKNGEAYPAYVSRMKNEHLHNLRDLGSEGQNFLPGSKPYSPIAFNIGTSFSTTYLMKRWAFKGEIKVVYTSTDYLDDFGPGLWFGGDYDAMRAAAYDKLPGISEADLNKISNSTLSSKIAPNTPRSTNGLNDWYFQAHMGASYILFK